jgi:hypothetical protein
MMQEIEISCHVPNSVDIGDERHKKSNENTGILRYKDQTNHKILYFFVKTNLK